MDGSPPRRLCMHARARCHRRDELQLSERRGREAVNDAVHHVVPTEAAAFRKGQLQLLAPWRATQLHLGVTGGGLKRGDGAGGGASAPPPTSPIIPRGRCVGVASPALGSPPCRRPTTNSASSRGLPGAQLARPASVPFLYTTGPRRHGKNDMFMHGRSTVPETASQLSSP